jgi:hypothetical protein
MNTDHIYELETKKLEARQPPTEKCGKLASEFREIYRCTRVYSLKAKEWAC